jgi:hypothetical protein
MAHDWHTQKMSLLKPRMISNPEWSLLTQLELPDSVGFVVYRRSAKRPDASDPPVQGH